MSSCAGSGSGEHTGVHTEVESMSSSSSSSSSSSEDGITRRGLRRKAAFSLDFVGGTGSSYKHLDGLAYVQTHSNTFKKMEMRWDTAPETVLMIKKPWGEGVTESLDMIARWLMEEKGLTVVVEPSVAKELPHLSCLSSFSEVDDLSHVIDFVVCIGGDGTIMHVSRLFRGPVPPLVSFAMGSLGFLTLFQVEQYKEVLNPLLDTSSNTVISMRQRFECRVFHTQETEGAEAEDAPQASTSNLVDVQYVMNDVVIDRGATPFLTNLDCFVDDMYMTTVSADGIIVGTTTGSTAYSLSAGGCMVHPAVGGMCFTPISPHSLSARPIVLPDCVTLKVQVSNDARGPSSVAFDGRTAGKIGAGDYVEIRLSKFPVPCVQKEDPIADWFSSIVNILRWNDRKRQGAGKMKAKL